MDVRSIFTKASDATLDIPSRIVRDYVNTFAKCLLNYCRTVLLHHRLRCVYTHGFVAFPMREVSRWQIPTFANQTKILTNRGNEIQRDEERERERERGGGKKGSLSLSLISNTQLWCSVAQHYVAHCKYVVFAMCNEKRERYEREG